jgi:hypothetical protein
MDTHVQRCKGATTYSTLQLTPLSLHWFIHRLTKHYSQSCRLWSIIHQFISSTPDATSSILLQDFISTAYILEDLICAATTSLSSIDSSHTDPFQHIISDLVNFYSRSDLHPKQVKFTKNSFAQSIKRCPIHTTPTLSSNPYHLLSDLIGTDKTMEIDSPTNHTPSIPPQKVSWSTDLGVSTLSEELFSHMSKQKIIAEETGKLDDFPDYKNLRLGLILLTKSIRESDLTLFVTRELFQIYLLVSFSNPLPRP